MPTGTVLFLAFGAARQGSLPALAPAVSLAGFAAGAVGGARLEAFSEVLGRRWFVIGLAIEAGLILAAAGTGWSLAPRYGGADRAAHGGGGAAGRVDGDAQRHEHAGERARAADHAGHPLHDRLPRRFALGHDSAFRYGTAAWVRRAAAVLAMSPEGWRARCWCGPAGR